MADQGFADYQLKILSTAKLKNLIRVPTFVDAEAAMAALNWSKGMFGQAKVIG